MTDLSPIRHAVAQARAAGLTDWGIAKMLRIDGVQLRRLNGPKTWTPEAKTLEKMMAGLRRLPSPENPRPWERRSVDYAAVAEAMRAGKGAA